MSSPLRMAVGLLVLGVVSWGMLQLGSGLDAPAATKALAPAEAGGALHLSALALLLVQMAVILAVSRVTGIGFRRIGQPLVVAEIVAGILLGPSGLGAVAPDVLAALFPPEGMDALSAVSQLGLVLFMFVVGLEFDFGLVRSRGPLALVISQYGMVVPFLFGTILALGLYPVFSTPDVPYVAFGMFLGASMSVTAFPVLARILSERGLMRTPIGALTLTCAAVGDVTAWCLLAVTIAVVRAGSFGMGIVTTGLAVAFVAAMVGVLRPLLARVAARYGTTDDLGQTAVAAILLALLLCATLAEAIGIHALFGAFLFGVVVPRQGQVVRALIGRVEDLVVVLLLPLFFAFTGLRTEIGLLSGGTLWAWCGLIILVATVGKIAGTAVPARLGGLSWRESATIGILMNTRGLMELVILNIGRDLGVLSPTLFTMLVIMAVVTTVVTSPLIGWLQPPERVLAGTAEASPQRNAVLACVAHPESAVGLARITAALCRGPGARGWALRLIPIGDQATLFPEGTSLDEDDTGASAAELLAAEATRLGAQVEAFGFPSSSPPRDIVAVAALKEADVIVLGLHRPLMGTAWLGGPLLEITQHARQTVCMFHDTGLVQPRRVLLLPGGEHAEAAKSIADRLALHPQTLVTVFQPPKGEAAIPALLTMAVHYDLVVASVGPEWGLAMNLFDVRVHPLVTDLPCSLLAVHGANHPRGPGQEESVV
ncbi:MAG: cation:proton antiporter [Pseudomonadota bacterium]|nr:cation:proton antiporter [Pseudomonadota bacterium]